MAISLGLPVGLGFHLLDELRGLRLDEDIEEEAAELVEEMEAGDADEEMEADDDDEEGE